MMNDGYAEHIVKAKTPKGVMTGIVIGAAVIVSGIVALFISKWGLTIILVGVIFYHIFFSRRKTEYEYIMVNEDVDISKIIAKQSRKKMYSFSNKDVKFYAKAGSIYLDNELQRDSSVKKLDYSSGGKGGDEAGETYVFVLNINGKTIFVKLDLSEKTLDHVQTFMKGKYKE